jgi:predicted RNA binding protein YcfA (HicA-like mRNA interferase family)
MSGRADANLSFDKVCSLLIRPGFTLRQARGSHHFFKKPGCDPINLQNQNGKAKPYQIRQIREILKDQTIQ